MTGADSFPVQALVGRPVGEQYRIARSVGSGGMGAVYEAVNEETRHRAAVKVLFPEYAREARWVERLFREAQAVNIVNHPGLVKIFSCGYLEETPALPRLAYILMEYLEGETLWRRFQRLQQAGCPFPVAEALRIGRQVAAALCAVHEQGIVHRDLKADNVFLVADPEVPAGERSKILDFGIAKFQHAPPEGQRTTGDRVLGTPVYMSPEQCRGAVLTGRSDVYSLGVMLYELLGGRPPFDHDEAVSLMAMHLRDQAPPLRRQRPELPEEVEALVQEMLRKDPLQRPAMVEVEDRLERLEEERLTPPTSPLIPPRLPEAPSGPLEGAAAQGPRQRLRARGMLIAASFVGCLALGGAAGWLAERDRAPGAAHGAVRRQPAAAERPAAVPPSPALPAVVTADPAPVPAPVEPAPAAPGPRGRGRHRRTEALHARETGGTTTLPAAPPPAKDPPASRRRLELPDISDLSPAVPGRR